MDRRLICVLHGDAHLALLERPHRGDRRAVRALDAAEAVVRHLVAVDGDARAAQAGALRLGDDLRGEPARRRVVVVHDHPALADARG